MQTLGNIGEHEAIRRLVAGLGTHPGLRVGAGDDCAVCRMPGNEFDQVFTSDPVIENIHFLPSDEPARIGNKAAGRILSDIAAMGAQPQWILANVAAPPETDFQRLEGVYAGMTALCGRFGATIIGGDLAQGPCLELHLFGTGILPAGTALLRSGARPGDALFVTGPLGDTRRGKHLDFTPRVREGVFLRETGLASALMDISDGLATDLRHILAQSGTGAEIEAKAVPLNGTLEQALFDGEDFELLFTAPEEKAGALADRWPESLETKPVRIGTILPRPGGLRLRLPDGRVQGLEEKAFEHFGNR